MKTNYVLIDFENVQPNNLELLQGHDFRVLVFVGESQKSVPILLAEALQKLGDRGTYIRISGNGKNALDFHIAYYIGQLAEKDPNAFFHIISKDSGFDPLIQHLKSKKLWVLREKDLAEIPLLQISGTSTADERIDAIVKSLIARGTSRPRKTKTLGNSINALFQKTLEEKEITRIIQELQNRKLISIDKENISYHLPAEP